MNSSSTVEALAQDSHDNAHSYPMKQTELRPTHTLTPSQSSTITCTSTAGLVQKPGRKNSSGKGFSCWRRKPKSKGGKGAEEGLPTHGKGAAQRTNIWMGWKLLFFGSCECPCTSCFRYGLGVLTTASASQGLNVLILLIPATVSEDIQANVRLSLT